MRTIGIEYPEAKKTHFTELGEPPALAAREMLLRTIHSGITNGTERHALLGEHFWKGNFPSAHGYQHVAVVEEIGDEVEDFAVGDTVFLGQYVGHRGWNIVDLTPQAGAEYDGALCVKLAEGVAPREAALLGVAGVAMRGVRRFRVGPGDKVWVAGQGLIGHFAAQSARAVGAEVTVSDVVPKRLEIAQECGAHHAVNARDEDAYAQLEALGPFDCIIDGCGVKDLLLDIHAHNLLAYRGVVGILAVRMETVFHWGMMHLREASIEVSCHFSPEELRILMHFIAQGIIRIAPAITHNVPIDEALPIYEQLRDEPGNLLGVVFDWE